MEVSNLNEIANFRCQIDNFDQKCYFKKIEFSFKLSLVKIAKLENHPLFVRNFQKIVNFWVKNSNFANFLF